MIDINFNHSPDQVSVRLNLNCVESIIFYLLDSKNNEKLLIKYLTHGDKSVIFDKELIVNKLVRFQFYFTETETGIKSNKITGIISYKKINFNDYQLIVGGADYATLKKEGYYSVDRQLKVDLDQPIGWITNHRNFDFNINALRFLSSFWARYFKTFELNILYEIQGFIRQYYEHMNGDIHLKSPFIKYDMAIGIRSLHISLMSQFQEFLGDLDRNILEWLLRKHIELASDPKSFTLSNHGLWLIYGLRMLLTSQEDRYSKELSYCLKQFKRLLDFNFNEECVCTENSPFYHQYNIDLYKKIPIDLFSNSDLLKNTITKGSELIPWFIDQSRNYFQIGDTEGQSRTSFIPDHHEIYRTYDNEKFIYLKNLKKSGYFIAKVFNSEKQIESELLFYNSADSYVHKHLDGNAFIYFYRGHEIFADAGKYTYDHNELRKYFVSHYAHNTVTLSGVDFNINDLDLKKTGFKKFLESEDALGVESEVNYNQFVHRRRILLDEKGNISLFDQVQNKTSANVILNFILGKGIIPELRGEAIWLFEQESLIAKIFIDKATVDVSIVSGESSPYRGWISKEYQVKEKTSSIELKYPSKVKEVKTQIFFEDFYSK